jgi:heterodisulfide reductase subunit A-like polyferredoxin
MDTANRDKVGAVMVVGSGIAGIQASLDLANAGFYVYLVEKEPAIGGVMPQLDKTFPTNDCSMCIISPKLVDCANHRNIEILAPAEMVGLIPSCYLTSNIKIRKICHRTKFFRVFSEIIQSLTEGVLYLIQIPEGSISKILLP